jgi:hypothetical protein
MSVKAGWAGKVEKRTEPAADAALEQALSNFRLSVHAWSEVAYSRPRPAAQVARQGSWRLAAGWALGCVLAAGGVAGGVYVQRHHPEEAVRIHAAAPAPAQAARQQQQPAVAPPVREEDEDLLAKVDSDVSRQVPNAMEPLAQLMTEDETE